MSHEFSQNWIFRYTTCIVRKSYNLDMSQTLSGNRRKSEKEATHPTRRVSFGQLKTENMLCSSNRKQKKII